MREPSRWMLDLGPPRLAAELLSALGRAAAGVEPGSWSPPRWLYPHQRPAALRLAAALESFGGALLADAVGLGKTYVALALATRVDAAVAVVPATLREQWCRVAAKLGVLLTVVTHEALSRRGRVPGASLVIVDEAHRFRNPATRRYHRLALDVRGARLLLISATPVVNRGQDLHHLLRLFLPDRALAVFGVPSLERAITQGAFQEVLHASAPLIVSRTPATAGRLPAALPAPMDRGAIRAPPVERKQLMTIIRAVDRLCFPGFGAETPELLRRHLLHRLASSVEAARETVRRHRAYCARARDAAVRGEPLTRGVARRLFGADDDGQLDLGALDAAVSTSDLGALDQELERLDGLSAELAGNGPRPKDGAFRTLMQRRDGRKTLVFTVARATALRLAEVLAWRRVAVVTGSGARIASGRIVAEDAFALFAPAAHDRPPPRATLQLDILVATDLASEGLDLQDADAVVHYDLPWTPVRLAQRIGRIARLGSPHARVEVCWFVPPRLLERRLALVSRLRRKVHTQLRLAVPSTSAVGRARVVSAALDARERIVLDGSFAEVASPGHAWARGSIDVFALRWNAGDRVAHELIGLSPRGPVLEPETLHRCIVAAGTSPATDRAEPAAARLASLVRRRLAAAAAGPTDSASRRLSRRILRRARAASAARRAELIGLLDGALARVHAGLSVGEERALAAVLATPKPGEALALWIARTPLRTERWEACGVAAALLATGPCEGRSSD